MTTTLIQHIHRIWHFDNKYKRMPLSETVKRYISNHENPAIRSFIEAFPDCNPVVPFSVKLEYHELYREVAKHTIIRALPVWLLAQVQDSGIPYTDSVRNYYNYFKIDNQVISVSELTDFIIKAYLNSDNIKGFHDLHIKKLNELFNFLSNETIQEKGGSGEEAS